MKQRVVVLLAVALVLMSTACGGGSSSSSTTSATSLAGTWAATLTPSTGTPADLSFNATLAISGGINVLVSGLTFNNASNDCFGQLASVGGTYKTSIDGTTTTFSLKFFSNTNANNQLAMNGTLSSSNVNTISGTWTLTGGNADCNGGGNFSMVRQ